MQERVSLRRERTFPKLGAYVYVAVHVHGSFTSVYAG